MSNNKMNTGTMPTTTINKNTKAGQQTIVNVNSPDMMTQSSSRGRGPFMDLKPGVVLPGDSQFK